MRRLPPHLLPYLTAAVTSPAIYLRLIYFPTYAALCLIPLPPPPPCRRAHYRRYNANIYTCARYALFRLRLTLPATARIQRQHAAGSVCLPTSFVVRLQRAHHHRRFAAYARAHHGLLPAFTFAVLFRTAARISAIAATTLLPARWFLFSIRWFPHCFTVPGTCSCIVYAACHLRCWHGWQRGLRTVAWPRVVDGLTRAQYRYATRRALSFSRVYHTRRAPLHLPFMPHARLQPVTRALPPPCAPAWRFFGCYLYWL